MKEKVLTNKKNGMLVLLLTIILYMVAASGVLVWAISPPLYLLCVAYLCLGWLVAPGLKVLGPQEALVLTLFGKYIGTLKGAGFYFVNPFCSAVNPAAHTVLGQSSDVKGKTANKESGRRVSLKIMTLNNSRQKINDCLGNPVEIGIAVTWRVVDTCKAVFDVDNYKEFLSLQCDSALRNIVRLSPKLYAAIAAWAEDDFRSVNGQIEYLLSECVRQRRKNGKYVSDELDKPLDIEIE